MPFKTPTFWYGKSGKLAQWMRIPLEGASLIYQAGRVLSNMGKRPYQSHLPVLCIGNLVAGGSGKTPVALALYDLLISEKLCSAPCFLTRGYGGREKGPLRVEPNTHDAAAIGDEPLLLSTKGPVVVSANRKAGAQRIETHGADAIVMDDGLQNPGLAKTLSFVAIDGRTGFGNGKLLPAGPLREPLATGLARADAFILIGEDQCGVKALLPPDIPVFHAHLAVPHSWIADTKSSYIAFTGLGQPNKFKASLEDLKIKIVDWQAFPDHHTYSVQELSRLAEKAREKGARLITTEKDAVKIPERFIQENPLDILPVEICWEEPETLKSFLRNNLKKNAQPL